MSDRIYALYTSMETAVTAVNEVIMKGVSSENVSVITRDPDNKYARYIDITEDDDVEGDEGAGFGAAIGALTGLAVATIPGLGPIFATGPLAAALLAGVGAGTGAVTGGISAALIDFGAGEDDVEHYERVLTEGGALVIIDTLTDEQEDEVERILTAYHPLEIED